MKARRGISLLVFLIFALFIPQLLMAQTVSPVPAGKAQVVAVSVEGNLNVPTEQILEMVSTKIGDTLDEAKLKADVQSISDLGFFTDVKERTDQAPNGVKVVYVVVENPTVKQVDVEGAQLIPPDKVRSLMKTVVGKILNTRTLYGDVLAINEYYASQGYTDPSNHVVDLTWHKDGVVHLKIKEGIPITAIEIQGNSVYTTAQLRRLVHSKIGEIFNRKKMEDDLGNIAELYKSDNWVLTGLKGDIHPDGTVVVDITETVVESMRIEGNKRTKENTFFRYVHTKVGSVLNKKKVQADIRRLNNTGFFSDVNVDPEEGTEPGKVVLVWKVKENRSGTASIGLGYSGATGINRAGLTGAITLSENNISGTGQGASISWQRGLYVDELNIGYTNPFIDKAEDSVSINWFNINYYNLNQPIPGNLESILNPLTSVYGEFSDHESGATLTFGHPVFDEYTRIFATLEHENISSSSSTLEFSESVLPLTVGTVNSVGLSIVRDTRDDIYDTYKGAYYSLSYTKAGPPLGGNFNFNQYQEDVREYFPIGGRFSFAARALTGWDDGGVPITNWFVLGGPDTLRGYSLDSFIGTKMFIGQAELRFPVGKQKLFDGAIFYDMGNAWQPGQHVNITQLYHDYGIGVRLKLPALGLGVIRLDFALGGTQGSRAVIGIGQTF